MASLSLIDAFGTAQPVPQAGSIKRLLSKSMCSTIALAGFTQDECTVMVAYLARHLPREYTLARQYCRTANYKYGYPQQPATLEAKKPQWRVPSIVLSDREQQLTNARCNHQG